MRSFVPRCSAGINDVTVRGRRVEKVGGEAGGFVLEDEETAAVGG